MTVSFEPLRRTVDGLVHGSVGDDSLTAMRHSAFIAAHLAIGLCVLLLLPISLALSGAPSVGLAGAFALLALPLPIAAFLSRTGRYEVAHLLSAVALAALVAWVGAFTGGLASPALLLLALLPAEAALSATRRAALAAIASAIGAIVLLGASSILGLPSASAGFAPILVAAGLLHGAGLAFRIARVQGAAENAAREGEARYRLLAENGTDLITRHDRVGAVEYASPSGRGLLGCAPAELVGHGLFDRVHVADRPAFLHALSETDRTGEARSLEFRLRGPAEAGGFLFVEMRCRAALDAASGARSVIAVTRDVTEARQRQSEIADARTSAEAADKSQIQLIAHVSHELRTPLNAIIGFSELLERELFGKFEMARHRDYIRLIHSSGEHLLQVVNSVLDMSKIEAGRFAVSAAPFPVAGMVDGALEILSQQIADRGLRLVREIEPGLPDLVADRRACRQILLNLLSNAAKFTAAGGSITVIARREGDGLVLAVRDTGVGIAAIDLPRIGTPFVQLGGQDRDEGTGLGLSVVRGLAELQGGTFTLESEPGRGTTATVRLPLAGTRALPSAMGETVLGERERRRA
jgi:cell cycle sensor histidine kinase DivJ